MYENLLKLIQQAETADRIGKIENVVGMSMEASGGRSGIGDIVMIYNEAGQLFGYIYHVEGWHKVVLHL